MDDIGWKMYCLFVTWWLYVLAISFLQRAFDLELDNNPLQFSSLFSVLHCS